LLITLKPYKDTESNKAVVYIYATMKNSTNALNWFEIPASDLKRARLFYEYIFGITMTESEMGAIRMAFFPAEPGSGKVSGFLPPEFMGTCNLPQRKS
jgi:predicted enzyme related to lactoylglutathione lyase